MKRAFKIYVWLLGYVVIFGGTLGGFAEIMVHHLGVYLILYVPFALFAMMFAFYCVGRAWGLYCQ